MLPYSWFTSIVMICPITLFCVVFSASLPTAEVWIPNVKCRMSNIKCLMSNAELWMSNVECWMPNSKCRMLNSEGKIQEKTLRENSKSKLWGLISKGQNLRAKLWRPSSEGWDSLRVDLLRGMILSEGWTYPRVSPTYFTPSYLLTVIQSRSTTQAHIFNPLLGVRVSRSLMRFLSKSMIVSPRSKIQLNASSFPSLNHLICTVSPTLNRFSLELFITHQKCRHEFLLSLRPPKHHHQYPKKQTDHWPNS